MDTSSYDDKLIEWIIKKLAKNVGCIPPMLQHSSINKDVVICTDQNKTTLVRDILTSELNTKGFLEKGVDPPCKYMKTKTKIQSERVPGKEYLVERSIWFAIPSVIIFMKQTEGYSSLSLLAEIGGYVGLFLGLSIYHGIKDLFDKAMAIFVRFAPNKQPDT